MVCHGHAEHALGTVAGLVVKAEHMSTNTAQRVFIHHIAGNTTLKGLIRRHAGLQR